MQVPYMKHTIAVFATYYFSQTQPLYQVDTNCFMKLHIPFRKKASLDTLAISRIDFRYDPISRTGLIT